MKYINPNNIAHAVILEPGKKAHEWEKGEYGWRLVLYFETCPSVFVEMDSREDCERKAEILNLVLV